ncbi:MAG: hypothetical protein EZS28_032184 [Streblomastix strix]|uniref:Uncharacterized protein n=1 Tax=Streblomastix strix TaxID=222440 RepID=A0A5J4UP92_9EUKA|nr:MAG: hypothetical protein EZS28_032184 [Streblomastix strix]
MEPIKQEQPMNDTISSQLSSYQTFLAQLLAQIADASAETKHALANRDHFKELVNALKWARSQNKDLVQLIQEQVCEVVQSLVDQKGDIVEIGFESDMVKELQILLQTIPLEDVKLVHANALKLFTTYGTFQIKKQMNDMKVPQSIIRNMKSKDPAVVEKTCATITNIIIDYREMTYQSNPIPNPYLPIYKESGVLSALFQDGVQNSASDNIKTIAAFGIGFLHRGSALDPEMKSSVVSTLKKGTKNQELSINYLSMDILCCLAWNNANHEEILKEDFIAELVQILQKKEVQFTPSILDIARILLSQGTIQTQSTVISAIPLPQIRILTRDPYSDIRNSAFLLLSWISSRADMLKFQDMKIQVSGKSAEIRNQLAQGGLLNDICEALKQGRNNVDDKGGVVISALKVAEILFDENEEIFLLILGKGKFIDEISNFYKAIESEQLTFNFISVLQYIDFSLYYEKLVEIKTESFLAGFTNVLNSRDEDVIIITLQFLNPVICTLENGGEFEDKDPALPILQKNGGLKRLIEIFKSENSSDEIKKYSAFIIGSLHKDMKLPIEIRDDLIELLKKMADDEDNLIFLQQSCLALARLAEEKGNTTAILSGDFSSVLRKYISNEDVQTYSRALMLSMVLLLVNFEDSNQKVRNGIPEEVMRRLKEEEAEGVSVLASNIENLLSQSSEKSNLVRR